MSPKTPKMWLEPKWVMGHTHTHTHSNLSLALNVAVRLAIDPEATQRGGRKKVVVVVYE